MECPTARRELRWSRNFARDLSEIPDGTALVMHTTKQKQLAARSKRSDVMTQTKMQMVKYISEKLDD